MDFSETPDTLLDIYFASEVAKGRPTLAARAVLLGNIGAINSSVNAMLYDNPITLLPNFFMKKYASRKPNVVDVITDDTDKTANSSQGTTLVNPEKQLLTFTVPVTDAITIIKNNHSI